MEMMTVMDSIQGDVCGDGSEHRMLLITTRDNVYGSDGCGDINRGGGLSIVLVWQ